ncbi:Holliday junction resolvase RuvX [Spiroplasma platyhelix]|uniref:Putative pre-16S rRNA nuclease n=1 Tax=Spiroplasma platyhelix PALS-1 TaxID=1276218 RepID=A0A846TPH5_9MOLU|nr:Holliday junction resolvase RuvX [Spiroplasma platyhelix]MBE4703807.1 putative pre-16S rRNA nuclease [Spiroplasma platyhelix PALS-1]NKE38180.1 Holliday junction resolvase RuvX [Spiroplasma platyhelix PALS-1]UJB29065.1 Holliday junction resolvase-like protein [Spiroplasma platyhelix PALS-1]
MKYLAIDLGSKTLGLARGTGLIASPWKTLRFKENDFDQALQGLLLAIKEYQPDEIILGYPLNMNGSIGESAETVLQFKKMLEEKIDSEIAIVLLDERRTTFSANQVLIAADLSRKARKEKKDQVAATIILQTYFDKINFQKQRKEEDNDK